MDLTLIIPVYNSGEFLGRLFDNLSAQPIFAESQGEIIFVNDGSTDDSEQLILEFAESHPYVRYIACEHRGIQFTRNEGIRAAAGDYIAFMDSDDLMAIGSLDYMVAVAREHNAEVVRGWYEQAYDKDFENYINNPESLKAEPPIINHIYTGNKYIEVTLGLVYNCLMTTTVYNRHFILDNNLLLDERINCNEDCYFNWNIMSIANKVVILKNTYYKWLQRRGSLSNPDNLRNRFKFASVYVIGAEYLKELKDKYKASGTITDKVASLYDIHSEVKLFNFLCALVKYRGLTREQINPMIKRIKEAGIYPYPHAFPEMPPGYPTSLPYRLMWRLMSYEWILRIMLRLRCSKEQIIDL